MLFMSKTSILQSDLKYSLNLDAKELKKIIAASVKKWFFSAIHNNFALNEKVYGSTLSNFICNPTNKFPEFHF